jgi:hypothetical protein
MSLNRLRETQNLLIQCHIILSFHMSTKYTSLTKRGLQEQKQFILRYFSSVKFFTVISAVSVLGTELHIRFFMVLLGNCNNHALKRYNY